MSDTKRYKGKIRWFNKASKEGMIRSECGVSMPFYGCNAIGSRSGFSHLSCMDFEEGQDVEFEYHETLGAISVSGGVFNQEDYDRLNVKDSTFQMGEDGEFISGLFANQRDSK